MTTLLLGLIGSGKSTIGTILAQKTGARFVEMDTLVLQTLGVESPQNVSPALWKEVQLEVNKDLSTQDNLVIATSGNIVENDLNILYYKQHTESLRIIYLKAEIADLESRWQHSTPLNQTTLTEWHTERTPLYERFADHIVSTSGKTPAQIVQEIQKLS